MFFRYSFSSVIISTLIATRIITQAHMIRFTQRLEHGMEKLRRKVKLYYEYFYNSA